MGTVTDLARHTIEVGHLLAWVQMLVAIVLVPLVWALTRRLSEIRDHLARINGSVSEINQWRTDHDKRVEDENRHHEMMMTSCTTLHGERMASVLREVEQLWGRVGDRRKGLTHTE